MRSTNKQTSRYKKGGAIKHDRQDVLERGLWLICRKGYAAVGVDELCQETGMTKGAFYHAFTSKESFLVRALRAYGQWNVARIHQALAPQGNSALDRLKEFYRFMLAAQPGVSFMGCMVNNLMSELGGQNPLVSQVTSQEFEHFLGAIEPSVKLAQHEGDLDPAWYSGDLTELIHSTFYGTLTRTKGLTDPARGLETMELLWKTLKRRNA